MAHARTVGDWVAISGAAISTGLGRASTLGTSLLMGSPTCGSASGGHRGWIAAARTPRCAGAARRRARPTLGVLTGLFRTVATWGANSPRAFHGTRRGWQYLSDGGHFENTDVYELLRPERRAALIVLCDCGCDADYRFKDLANLIRLARIDFGPEIVVDTAATDPVLRPCSAPGRLCCRRQPGKPDEGRAAAQCLCGRPGGAPTPRRSPASSLLAAPHAHRAGRCAPVRRGPSRLPAAGHRRPVLRRSAVGKLTARSGSTSAGALHRAAQRLFTSAAPVRVARRGGSPSPHG